MSTRRLRQCVRAILNAEGAPSAEVSILLADDETVRQLNRDYRFQDRPTDVLSFSQRECHPGTPPLRVCPGTPEPLGDVAISVETAARQASVHGVDLAEELALLGAHGVLHLLGYDDTSEAGAARMRRREALALAPKPHPMLPRPAQREG